MVADAAWPAFDPALLVDDEVTLAVQVNGKLRDTLTAPRGLDRGRGRGAGAGLATRSSAQLGGSGAAQGDCGSRPAGEYRRMMRASPALAAARSRSAAAGCSRSMPAAASGAVARRLRTVEVAPIPGQAGWLVRNALVDRLGERSTATPRYRLDVELDDNITGFGIRGDRAATRERRTLRARYRLVDLATGTVVLDATAGSDAGIDVVSSRICDRRRRADRARAAVRRSSPTRSSRGSRFTRRARAAGQ